MVTSKRVAWIGMVVFSVLPMISTVAAQERDEHARQREEQRVYDSARHEYHTWNADEDRRYRTYLNEHHRAYREYSRLSKKDQRAYWQWRHEHEDHR